MTPLHIVRLAEQFPPTPGGLAPGMLALSQAQQARGHAVTVITRAAPEAAALDAAFPFVVQRLPARSLLQLGWRAYDAIARLPTPPDVIHGHGPAIAAYLWRQRRATPPVVVTLHSLRRTQYALYRHLGEVVAEYRRTTGLPVLRPPRLFRPWSPHVVRELWLERFICRRADHLALVAAHFASELAAYDVAPQRATLIYNGSDFSLVEDTSGQTTSQKVVYIGRFDWHKRAHLLLQAWPQVQRRFPSAELWLIGAGEQKDDLHHLAAALRLADTVHLPGWLPHGQLRQVYAQAACLCLPSMSEGLSKVVLEAMSLAVPVVASDIPANRDVLEGGALGELVTEATPQAWAEAMSDLLAHPDPARQRARQAQAVVTQRYRWAHVAERLDAAYARLPGLT